MRYSGVEIDQYGRVINCPICGADCLFSNSDTCVNCGTFIINKCADTKREYISGWPYIQPSCNAVLDGSSRHCIYCGNQSTFFKQGLLDNWFEEYKTNYPDSYSEIAIKHTEEVIR